MPPSQPSAPDRALAAVRLPRYTKAELEEILGGGEDPFGVAEFGLTWLPKEDHFGVKDGARLVAHAGLRRLPIAVGGVATEVIGVGGVAVAPDVRGRGLARTVVGAALDHARTMGPRHALLFCRPPLVGLYQRLGWRVIEGEVLVEQPGSRVVTMPLRTMVTPLHKDASWPSGPVRLRSLPM
ncbi:GNAT family N-acetyltransferase [Streptomyces sp. TRM66268-LWL]|uniref:GNAT family N-acetyltransferase n=1 Tax=Streptomyces polyasparticus TaxID=2767826 RepID=A0ABR7SMZ7_9ACTN|nr:GNAT family N-acetyltransferase [Streptomyces polyasparticus]MBC9715871.1 GNAT family N-acetyltransferase [Streptomyces polyasparticus]